VGRILKGVAIALVVAAVVTLALFLTRALEGLVDGLMDRVGAVWTLGLVGAATVVLGLMWLRYGGTRILRRWGIVLKPARPEEGAAGPDAGTGPQRRPRLVGPRK
jgi:hypothetical protein